MKIRSHSWIDLRQVAFQELKRGYGSTQTVVSQFGVVAAIPRLRDRQVAA